MSFSPYSSSLDPLVFGSIIEPKRSDIELENNLSLWTNVQFTHDDELKSISSSPKSTAASLSGEDVVNYYELAQKQIMSTEQKLISNKTPVILPKISPSMTLEEMSKTLLIASAVYNSSLTPLPSPQQQHQHESPKKDPAEEEKRKRNTAASARFRIKKKQREQTMEKTVKEMAEKSTTLENRVKELELEIKFLRNLLIEKNAS